MNGSLYHSMLRVSVLTCALILLFDSGLITPVTSQLSDNTRQYLASSVGVFAGVEETDISKLTAELTRREHDLAQREAAFNERQIAVNLGTEERVQDPDLSTYVLSIILFILLVLIVLNYAMDYARVKRMTYEQQTV